MPDSEFRILLVEDDQSVRSAVAQVLRDEGYVVQTAADGEDAQRMFEAGTDLVLSDLNMPRVDGRALMKWVLHNHPGTAFIMLTAFGTIPQAVDAIKAGATAYLTKPLDPVELLQHVRKLVEQKQLRSELLRLKGQLREGWHYRHIIGKSPQMQHIFSVLDRVAPLKTTVLITGESGTGKEMVARALHENSPRRGKPFLALNCAAIPENLIESTLFGHERGAFTGADKSARGYFRDADGGTLLLDEIGELPLGMQSKLLRVLEDGAVTPVGQTSPVKVDVRIVCATNRDLEAEVKEGKFRQDLFFRLNIVRIDLPPLRQRTEDIPILARFFLDEICRTNGFEPREMDESFISTLQRYDWPGNVRELKNTLESIVVLSGSRTLQEDDLPDKFFKDDANFEASDPGTRTRDLNLEVLSKQAILKALEATRGNRTEAARHLGISRRTLHRRLNEFGLRE
jgi:DNA-binding NtrC family response regulator